MTKLKPCPFCGGDAEINTGSMDGFYVTCDRCLAKMGHCWIDGEPSHEFSVEETAIAAWNTRAAPVVTDAMVDAAWQEVYAAYGYDADMNMDRLLRAAIQAALGVR